MDALWRGDWQTRTRIVTGLILFIYVTFHLINIGVAWLSPSAGDIMQDVRGFIVRSWPGTVLLYGALFLHAVLALWKVAAMARLRLSWVDFAQVGAGIAIPLLLSTHIVFTRLSSAQFETHDTVAYIAGLIWNTPSGWQQAALLIVTWLHGCIGMHMWLRMTPFWRRNIGTLGMLAALVPTFALAGFIGEGRRARALMTGDDDQRREFFRATNWPDWEAFAALTEQRDIVWWIIVAILGASLAAYLLRHLLRLRERTLTIEYVNGPTIHAAPGPTLLQLSQAAGVPHTSLCGGRGRCTTCRVTVEAGVEHLPPPTDAELKALSAAGAAPGARLACQVCPTGPIRVYRQFRPDGKRARRHSIEGKEAQLAVLFLDMRGFTARTTGQLPYDVVHLLNRFFDAIVPPITKAGGTVDKYLGDGLLALFETSDAESSAQASLAAARGIGDELTRFNEGLIQDGENPVRIGLSLHLGTVVIGEIGAAGNAPRTLIGDTVNTASRLEAQTKELAVEALMSRPLLEAAGVNMPAEDFVSLELRGVAEPLQALPVAQLAQFDPDRTAVKPT